MQPDARFSVFRYSFFCYVTRFFMWAWESSQVKRRVLALALNLQRPQPAQRQSLRTGRGLKRMRFYFQAGVGGSKETDSRGRTVAEG